MGGVERRSRGAGTVQTPGEARGVPGKRTLTEDAHDGASGAGANGPMGAVGKRSLTEGVTPRTGGGNLPHQARMEAAFGESFSDLQVRLGVSDEMAAMGARAETRGNQVSFASNAPDPGLVAHELTHVVQQRRGGATSQAKPIEAGERDALETEAEAVGARVAAGGSAGAITGSTQGTGLRDPDPAATDTFPSPQMLQVLGDRFKLSFRRGKEQRFFCDVHYEGALEAEAAFLKDNTLEMSDYMDDPKRPIKASIKEVGTDFVLVDAYGDGLTIGKLSIKTVPKPDARQHTVNWRVGAHAFGATSWLTIKLPVEQRTPPSPDGKTPTTDGKPPTTTTRPRVSNGPRFVSFTAVDTFTLTAVPYGDTKSAAVSIAGPAGVLNPTPQTIEVALDGDGKLEPKLLKNDGRDITFDLNGNGKADLSFVHTVKETSKSPDGKNSLREHHFRRFDKDGVLVDDYKGGLLFVVGGPVVAIPKTQDETTNAPDINKEAPATRPPAQGDVLGELPEALTGPGNVIEMRIDGDGDRTKELLLRFKGIAPSDPASKNGQIRIDVVQVSSVAETGTWQTATFDTTADAVKALAPRISQVADGHSPSVIDVISSIKSDFGATLRLSVAPPTTDPATKARTYRLEMGGQAFSYTVPAERTPTNKLVKGVDALENVGNVARFQIELGEHGDKFWVMHEAQSGGGDVFSIAAVNPEGPVAARGAPLVGGSAVISSFQQVDVGPLAFGIDTNKDDKPDIQIHDALSAPTLSKKPNSTLKQERDHHITVHGPAIGAERKWSFYVRDGKFWQSMSDDFGADTADKQAATAAMSTHTLAEQAADSQTKDEQGKVTKQGDVNALLSRVAGALTANRQKAKQAGLINAKLFDAWHDLAEQMIALGPQIGVSKVDPKLQEAAALNAEIMYRELAAATAGQTESDTEAIEGYSETTTTNKYTGDSSTVRSHGADSPLDGPGIRLPGEIRGGKWDRATADFQALVRGLDRWVAAKQPAGSEAQKQQQYLVGMQDSMKEIQSKPGMVRVMASFTPDQSYNTNTRTWGEIPLMLFAWKEGGKWWLKDITNPGRDPFLDRVDAKASEVHPPREIFEQLDYARHFPKGVLHYQVPDGPGGQIVTTQRKEWYEFLQWVGLGLAVVGFSLATFGTGAVAATAAAVAFAASGVASAVYAGGDLYERAKHGDLEPGAVIMDVAQIVAGVFSAGAAISGRIVAAAAQADIAAAKGAQGAAAWSGAAARIASVAQKAYIPAVATAAGADVVNLLALGAEIAGQITAIREGEGSDTDKKAAIAALIAQGLVLGGITILSVKGSMPEIFSGRPTIVIDVVNGIPIARANHLEIAGGKINATGGADAQASARWQTHGIEEAALEGNAAAKALKDDPDFMKGYREWMSQPEPKVTFGPDGKPKLNLGKDVKVSPGVEAQLQKFVDTPGVGITLYEKAWAYAGDLAKVEAAITKRGGKLDMEPGSASWKEARPDIVKALGGDASAEALVARYERFRGGASAMDPSAFLAERNHLRTLIPDTEVERLRALFPEYEVYVTGAATQTAKQIKPNISDIDLIVVVPKGTAPELMAAIEARARGQHVRPDPSFLQANGLDPNHAIGLDVKVMTPDQFFGFATASGATAKGRTPLNFTRIDQSAEQMTAAVAKGGSPNDWIAHLKQQLNAEGRVDLDAQLKVRTPQQIMDSFDGDFALAIEHLSKPGGDKPAPLQDTVDMFGVGTIPKSGPPRWKYIEDATNWKPERAALHDRLIEKAKEQALAFADAVQKGEPTLYAMRGNTAAGKTRAVGANVGELAGAMTATKDLPHRSVNPDNFKADLIAATPGMTSTQVHSESSMLATRLERELLAMKTSDGKELGSILIDKRLAGIGDVQMYAKMAKDSGRKFVLYDVDAPLEVSLAGVLERQPGGADPLPPFEIVAGGFTSVRNNRGAVIDFFSDGSVGNYTLFGTRPSGQRVEIANIVGGKLTVIDENLYKVARANGDEIAELLAKKRITSQSIDELVAELPSDRQAKVGAILRKYEGWTWKSALDAHSVEKPPVK